MYVGNGGGGFLCGSCAGMGDVMGTDRERIGNGRGSERPGSEPRGSDEGFESSFPGVRRRRRLNPATRAIRLPPIIRKTPYSSSRGDGLSSNPKDDICTHRCQFWYLLVVPSSGV